MRACTECRFLDKTDGLWRCKNANTMEPANVEDAVINGRTHKYQFAKYARVGGPCGVDGKFFEPKERGFFGWLMGDC